MATNKPTGKAPATGGVWRNIGGHPVFIKGGNSAQAPNNIVITPGGRMSFTGPRERATSDEARWAKLKQTPIGQEAQALAGPVGGSPAAGNQKGKRVVFETDASLEGIDRSFAARGYQKTVDRGERGSRWENAAYLAEVSRGGLSPTKVTLTNNWVRQANSRAEGSPSGGGNAPKLPGSPQGDRRALSRLSGWERRQRIFEMKRHNPR